MSNSSVLLLCGGKCCYCRCTVLALNHSSVTVLLNYANIVNCGTFLEVFAELKRTQTHLNPSKYLNWQFSLPSSKRCSEREIIVVRSKYIPPPAANPLYSALSIIHSNTRLALDYYTSGTGTCCALCTHRPATLKKSLWLLPSFRP